MVACDGWCHVVLFIRGPVVAWRRKLEGALRPSSPAWCSSADRRCTERSFRGALLLKSCEPSELDEPWIEYGEVDFEAEGRDQGRGRYQTGLT